MVFLFSPLYFFISRQLLTAVGRA